MDMTLAREDQLLFEEYLRICPIPNSKIDLSVCILNTGYWPTYRTSDLNLPVEMVRDQPSYADLKLYLNRNIFQTLFSFLKFQVTCVEVLKDYYQSKSRKRRLNWIYSLGSCNILGKFDAKTIELVMSTYQVIYFINFIPWIQIFYQVYES